MSELKALNLNAIMKGLAGAASPVSTLWQEPDMMAFLAKGRSYRSEFHVDPSDEVMVMIKGDADVHYIAPDGEHRIARVREGEVFRCPAGTPHSPRFAPEAFMLVLERKRRPGEEDRFQWYCDKCKEKLFEVVKHVGDYREDPVSRAYEAFHSSEANRKCRKCGHVAPPGPAAGGRGA
jgi:3-hydroxyanthranilate 3,4-dioxygenase